MRLFIVLLLSGLFAGPAQAVEFQIESLDRIVKLHGVWRFRTGDDLAWASPDYDHRNWDNILVPRDWRRQGHGDLTGMAWYRATLRLDLDSPAVNESLHKLAVSLGKVHSAYELYAGGRLLGGAGRVPPRPEAESDRIRIFSIPPDAVGDNGELVLAVRVWREPTLGGASTSGMYEGNYMVGTVFDLTKEVYLREALILMLALSYAMFGVYHLYLYTRNRRLPEFLWFGVTTILVAVYSTEVAQWKHIVDFLAELPQAAHRKIEYAIIYLLPATGLQLVFSLLRYTPPGWVRFYQYGFIAFSLTALLVPGTAVLVHSLFIWQAYTMPGLAGVLFMVIWFAAQGNTEARTMSLGWALFLFTAINDILMAQGLLQTPRLLTVGFAATLVSMAVSLANRFTRMYNQMDSEVRERTEELEASNRKLVDAARSDILTGLLNRRGYMEVANAEMARAQRTGRPFVVIMGDIDRFKSVNDRYGHVCGDYVLTRAAELLSDQLRDVDTVARWGGEEFIFLLPETSLEGGQVLAEKLRKVVEGTLFSHDGATLRLTITLGVAAYEDRMVNFEDCIAVADSALYRGKQTGRNRVVVAPGHAPASVFGEIGKPA